MWCKTVAGEGEGEGWWWWWGRWLTGQHKSVEHDWGLHTLGKELTAQNLWNSQNRLIQLVPMLLGQKSRVFRNVVYRWGERSAEAGTRLPLTRGFRLSGAVLPLPLLSR